MNKDEWLKNFYKVHEGNVVEELELYVIQDMLHRCGNQKLEACRRLGISNAKLYAKLNKYGLMDDFKKLNYEKVYGV